MFERDVALSGLVAQLDVCPYAYDSVITQLRTTGSKPERASFGSFVVWQFLNSTLFAAHFRPTVPIVATLLSLTGRQMQ